MTKVAACMDRYKRHMESRMHYCDETLLVYYIRIPSFDVNRFKYSKINNLIVPFNTIN